LILATEIARTQAALSKQELAAALTRLVRLESEAETAKAEAARLTVELAEARRLRTAELDASAVEREGARRVPVLAAQAASVHGAKLDRDLHAALRRIADLEAQADAAEAEAAGLAGQLDDARTKNSVNLERLLAEAASRQEALDAARQRIARLEAAQPSPDTQAEGPADESQEAGRPTQAGRPAAPSLGPGEEAGEEAGQPAALLESDAARRVAAQAARPEPSAPPDSIDVDSLVAEPGRYDTRRVVVTGFLMRLLQHYRLQSESGVRTLVVDVDGLHRDQYELLQQAIADAGLIGSVRAQISGKVERGSETAFRLVASDLRLIE
jgi:hypothetical protein